MVDLSYTNCNATCFLFFRARRSPSSCRRATAALATHPPTWRQVGHVHSKCAYPRLWACLGHTQPWLCLRRQGGRGRVLALCLSSACALSGLVGEPESGVSPSSNSNASCTASRRSRWTGSSYSSMIASLAADSARFPNLSPAVKHRIETEKADWIIYITDMGQAMHFEMVGGCCCCFCCPTVVARCHCPAAALARHCTSGAAWCRRAPSALAPRPAHACLHGVAPWGGPVTTHLTSLSTLD